MSDDVQIVGKKLDEITVKLDSLSQSIAMLINTLQKTNEELGQNVKTLTESVEKYVDITTESSKVDFEHSRENILQVSNEITMLSRMTGADQMMRINQALNGILSVLQQTIDPNKIQAQLYEISQFIKEHGGQ